MSSSLQKSKFIIFFHTYIKANLYKVVQGKTPFYHWNRTELGQVARSGPVARSANHSSGSQQIWAILVARTGSGFRVVRFRSYVSSFGILVHKFTILFIPYTQQHFMFPLKHKLKILYTTAFFQLIMLSGFSQGNQENFLPLFLSFMHGHPIATQ